MKRLFNYPVLLILIISAIGCGKDDDTPANPVSGLADVLLVSATDITSTSMKFTGEVKDEGTSAVIGRGFCWSINPNPTVNDDFSINAFGPGVFDHVESNLLPAQKYYVRAYATNGEGTAYSNEEVYTTSGLTPGMAYGGGYIVYVDNSGAHGLIVTASDVDYVPWGCQGLNLAATADSMGAGPMNTQYIVDNCSESGIAAKECANYGGGGQSDWFLPSIDELEHLRTNASLIPNLTTSGWDAWYWSSTQLDDSYARVVNFNQPSFTNSAKFSQGRVRAMRSF